MTRRRFSLAGPPCQRWRYPLPRSRNGAVASTFRRSGGTAWPAAT